jgi:hypothetical protein
VIYIFFEKFCREIYGALDQTSLSNFQTLNRRRAVAETTMSTMRRRQAPGEEPSSAMAVETTKGGKATWFWEAGGRVVETQPVTAEPMSASNAEQAEDEEWIISSDDALPFIASTRPLPRRCPKFPENGSGKEISEWIKACDRVYKLTANGCFFFFSFLHLR